jgi:hypothetical protein
MDHIKNMISLIPLKPEVTTSNPNFNQPCPHYYTYGHDKNHYFTLHLELHRATKSLPMLIKTKVLGKVKKGKR